ncbi:MAG: flavodoxin [Lachnospiraceae bacterium]
MSKIAIVYWSGTGNTQRMAEAVAEGVKEKGTEAVLLTTAEFDATMMGDYDAIAFGCPAMGVEQLEEGEFEPIFEACKPSLQDKKIALFGSYGWGDGEWMRNWENDCVSAGATLVVDSVICNDAPDDEAITACKNLGAALV